MARGNGKLRLLFLERILNEKTDDSHGLTIKEIQSELRKYDVEIERKTFYKDLESLRSAGIDIIGDRQGINHEYCYHIGGRQFELAELKLLIDSVQSAKFITEKKSNELIKKIGYLLSDYDAKQLQRQVYMTGRVKTDNEKIYYNVDKIHTAIAKNVKINFQYFQWTVDKKTELRHNGKIYCISPWALSWDDENYYLVGYDAEMQKLKHYRVDKMLHLELTHQRREGGEQFHQFDMASYAKKVFGMFGGDEYRVKLRCENKWAGVMIDRFGKSIKMHRVDEEHMEVLVDVALSRQFLGWLIALGDGIEVLEPQIVRDEMRKIGQELLGQYGGQTENSDE